MPPLPSFLTSPDGPRGPTSPGAVGGPNPGPAEAPAAAGTLSSRSVRADRALGGSVSGRGSARKAEELALLGTDPGPAVAARIRRTVGAVAQKRATRKVPPFRDRRRCSRPTPSAGK